MFEQAFDVTRVTGGWIVGSAASRHLASDIPVGRVDVLVPTYQTPYDANLLAVGHFGCDCRYYEVFELEGTSINIIKPCDQAHGTDPTQVIDIFMSVTDMSINMCYYDAHGAFHSTAHANDAAATRSMEVLKTQLDRVHKYRKRGFEVVYVFACPRCVYSPDIDGMIRQSKSVKTLILRNMTITDELMATLPPVDNLEFQDCTMDLVSVRATEVFMSRCVGYVQLVGCIELYTRNDCETLMIEIPDVLSKEEQDRLFVTYVQSGAYVIVPRYNWSCTPDTFRCESDQMLLDLKGMSFMEDYVTPDHASRIVDHLFSNEVEITDSVIDDLLSAMSRNRDMCETNGCSIFHVLTRWPVDTYPRIRVPVEWIHCLGLLMWLALHGMCTQVHHYSTPYVRCTCGGRFLSDLDERALARLFAFDIPVFVTAIMPQHARLFDGAIFRKWHVVDVAPNEPLHYVIDLNLDGIRDMIEQAGATSEFLNEQIKLDYLHENALCKLLRQ